MAALDDEAFATETALVEDYREDTSNLVELHYPVDADVPYKQRRLTSAFTMGFSYENFYPNKYTSIINLTDSYNDMFGNSEIPMLNMDIGYKYNFSLGSLIAGVGIGIGRLTDSHKQIYSQLEFTKTMAYAGYVMDSIFNEPYVAPYFMGGTTLFSIKESVADETPTGNVNTVTESGSTNTGFFYKVGALIQLNWIEDDVFRKGLIDYGLQNTYLDVFVTQYTTSISEDDPDIETGINFGAGLRVEF
jgi:hypothetical protein